MKTTGAHRLRFSVALTALGNGHKLKPMIILKNLKNVPKEVFPPGVHVTVSKGGSMTSNLVLQEYLPHVWRTRPLTMFKKPAMLVWDRHASHVDTIVTCNLQRHYSTTTQLIPAGMTPLLQPMDVSVNKVAKFYAPKFVLPNENPSSIFRKMHTL